MQQLTLAANAPAPPHLFRRLSPTKMADRQRQGLCYNYDEQYVRGHKCQRLFYLEVTNFDETEPPLPKEDQAQDPT